MSLHPRVCHPPKALDNLDHLACDAPEVLAAGVNRLYREHGFTILGGCCGTDERHIEAIGRLALA
ncbi:MAG: homocysteine S-methyltransferase family protein [Pseudomonadota bacterium]